MLLVQRKALNLPTRRARAASVASTSRRKTVSQYKAALKKPSMPLLFSNFVLSPTSSRMEPIGYRPYRAAMSLD